MWNDRSSRLALGLGLLLALSVGSPAWAQMPCSSCDLSWSSCDQQCYDCAIWSPGEPGQPPNCEGGYQLTTCGATHGACIRSGCTPSFQTVARENRGTYGEAVVGIEYVLGVGFLPQFSCTHHRVDLVTRHDLNQCNIDPSFWDISNCEDDIDGDRPGTTDPPGPDCCNPNSCPFPGSLLSFYNETFTCDHHHSCW